MDKRDEAKANAAAALRILRKPLTIAVALAALVLLLPGILQQTVSTTHATHATPVIQATPAMHAMPANSVERTAQPGAPGQPITWASDAWREPSGTGEWESDGGYWYYLEGQPANLLAP